MKELTPPDKQRADALVKMAEISLKRLRETNLEKYPSNSVVDLYDIIHKYADAIFARRGIKFRGDGAHHEIIEELATLQILTDTQLTLIKQMRTIRNRIQYEGYFVDEDLEFFIDLACNSSTPQKVAIHGGHPFPK